jgi:hypothetical protein
MNKIFQPFSFSTLVQRLSNLLPLSYQIFTAQKDARLCVVELGQTIRKVPNLEISVNITHA